MQIVVTTSNLEIKKMLDAFYPKQSQTTGYPLQYKLHKLDGTVENILSITRFRNGWSGEVPTPSHGQTYLCTYTEFIGLVEVSSLASKSNIAVVAIAGTVVLGLIAFLVHDLSSNVGVPADEDVLRAAHTVNTRAVVTDSDYSFRNGCDKSDTRKYDVLVEGKKVAIICQGNVNTYGIFYPKAPTIRYTAK
jgi:hypothetical protein